MHGLEHAGGLPRGIEIRAGSHSHSTLNGRAQIGDDVAEHVRRDDHIVNFWLGHHVHRAGIDVVIIGFDRLVIGLHRLKGTQPEIVGKAQHVRFGDQRHFLAPKLFRVFKGVANAPLDSVPRGHLDLIGHFVRRVLV